MTKNEENDTSTTEPTDEYVYDGPVTEVDIADDAFKVTGMDFILHNMYADPTDRAMTTYRKWFQDDTDAMLRRVASHVEQGLYRIVSLQLSKHSCMVVCASEKPCEEWPEGVFVG